MSESDSRTRRRWISLGEVIALAALAISAIGVWIAWKGSSEDKTTRIVEQRQTIPLTLRGSVQEDGRELVIAPVESSHALESLTLIIKGESPIEIGSDGKLDAGDLESALKDGDQDRKGGVGLPVRIDARYVEAGTDRRRAGTYQLRYRWEGGGLFGGRSLRITGLTRA
jgi:hypothetical protein